MLTRVNVAYGVVTDILNALGVVLLETNLSFVLRFYSYVQHTAHEADQLSTVRSTKKILNHPDPYPQQ